MRQRYFEHVYTEICVAVDHRISRYNLWLLVRESGGDPDELTHPQARHFVENNLSGILTEEGMSLSRRGRRQLERRILRFDPHHPTPEEWLTKIFDNAEETA
jgi:hypothetical protein